MEVIKIVNIIKELGHVNSKHDELREYCTRKFEQILQFLPRRIVNSDGPDLLGCILKGIPDTPVGSLKNKIKIIDKVLVTMGKESTSLTHCSDVISRLCLELPRLPAADLVRLCNDSVQSIIDDSDVNMIWRDVLPESMRSLSSHSTVKHCDTEMSSTEYKEQCVHTLCQCRWSERQLVQLAAMFKDMQLSKNSHKQVVNKICSYIIEIPPDTLPPLVHQLLRLCQLYNLEIVLAHLSNYFNTCLYSKLEPPSTDSESTTMDIDDIVPHSPEELSRCLSTCIYHISQGTVEPELVRKHIKSWPKTQLLRSPFIIDVALAISERGADFRSVCLDAIRLAIEQRAMDDLRKKESAWVRSVIPPDADVFSLLKVLTTECANHLELTLVGLINLAFSLLAVSRVKPCANICWSHGKLVLVRLSKAQPDAAGHILSLLQDKLGQDSMQKQYADCLHVLCKLTPASVERCTQLSTILENCQPTATEYTSAAAVLDAVHPLLSFSTRTRDVLVMVCRKGLYSRDSIHRCLALSGFLSLLRHIRLSRTAWSSQSGSDLYSGHSYLTQLTIDIHATQQGNPVKSRVRNEAVCIEVVSIVRRCLVQDACVKRLLYTNIYDCVMDKPVLHEPILEILYEHINKYLPEDQDNLSLKLGKCVQLTGATAVLSEPIAYLLYAIGQFTQGTEDEEMDDILASQAESGAFLKNKLKRVMDKLCSAEITIDLEGTGLCDLTPESKAKSMKVQQILQCYEALIAYKIMLWNLDSSNAASTVYKLFTTCNQLMEQTKTPSKGKKGSKTLNETKDTTKSQRSQKSQEKGKAPVKLSNLVKDRAGAFKPLPCVWDLRFCVRIIELLYSEEILWSSSEQRNELIGRRDFHRWAVKCVQCSCSSPLPRAVTHVLPVARVLYTRAVCRFEVMREFDETTALSCLDLFKTCLAHLFSPVYSLKMEKFLPTLTGQTDASPSVCIAAILEHIHTALFKSEMGDEEEADQMDKKIHASLSATAALLLEVPVETSVELNNVIVKMEDYVRTSKQDSTVLLAALLTASNGKQQEAPLLDQLLNKLSEAMGRIDEEDTTVEEPSSHFPYIDSKAGDAVLGVVCAHLAARYKAADHLLQRARDLNTANTVAVGAHEQRIEKELTELYKCIVVQLSHLTSWAGRCARLRCSVGGASDRVLTCCMRLLALLATLARQIPAHVARAARFERLLKLSGKKLSSIIDSLIMYLEESQSEDNASKILRDTKLIPRVVLEAENYSKHVIVLAKKAECDWQQYLSLGTARDFRIQAPVVQQVLNAREQPEDAIDDDTQENANDATNATSGASDIEDNKSDEETNTKRKRRRVS